MKLKNWMAAGAIGLALAVDGAETKTDNAGLTTQKQKASYGIGRNVGQRFKHDLIELDLEAFMRGFKDVLADTPSPISDEEMKTVMEALRGDIEAKAGQAAEKNKKVAEDWLAQNKSKEGVKTTATGLQYKVLKEGTGTAPKASDSVTVHYRGTLTDGTEFDSSYKRNEPATFSLDQVIPGWTEGVQLMKPGAKYQFFVPPALGYGDEGQGPIPPGAVLVFEIELLKVNGSGAEPAATKK
jgi:FKBP-type peptidyl-prolyl cis-trans isomerase